MKLRHRVTSVAALVVVAVTATVTAPSAAARGTTRPAPPPPFTPTFAPADCPAFELPGLPPELAPTLPRSCGHVTVPLRHDDPARGTIEIATALLPATEPGPDASTDPILLLGGGPGEKTVAPFSFLASIPGLGLTELRRTRDLVVIDQRGVGASRPALDCPEDAEAMGALGPDASRADVADALVAAAAACHTRLTAEGIDLSAFDTAANVRDLDLVRRGLGYERWHVFGTSYGARLAWQAARHAPDGMASMVLSSPVPAEANFVTDAPGSFADAVRGIVGTCAAEATCAAAYPDLAADTRRVLHRLRREPLEVTVPVPGEPVTVTVDDHTLAAGLFTMLYLPDGARQAPFVITSAARGDGLPLLAATSGFDPGDAVSTGMQRSFLCAEEVAYAERRDVARTLARSGAWGRAAWRYDLSIFARQCEVWPVARGEREVFRPLRTDVPTLVVTGQFDQITPPSYGRTVHRQARHSRYVEVPGAGHSPLLALGGCGYGILDAFVGDPAAPLDAACVPDAPGFFDEATARASLFLDQPTGQAEPAPVATVAPPLDPSAVADG